MLFLDLSDPRPSKWIHIQGPVCEREEVEIGGVLFLTIDKSNGLSDRSTTDMIVITLEMDSLRAIGA